MSKAVAITPQVEAEAAHQYHLAQAQRLIDEYEAERAAVREAHGDEILSQWMLNRDAEREGRIGDITLPSGKTLRARFQERMKKVEKEMEAKRKTRKKRNGVKARALSVTQQ
jgi:hypothetical protein